MKSLTAPSRRWFQFSTRDLLLGAVLVAMGVAGVVGTLRRESEFQDIPFPILFGLVYGSGGLVGAGLFSPFKKAAVGAIVGFLVTCAIVAMLV
ncbi:MAG TPA: hypothetical protein VGJ16_14525 [Pirellulales bacterium]